MLMASDVAGDVWVLAWKYNIQTAEKGFVVTGSSSTSPDFFDSLIGLFTHPMVVAGESY